MKLFEVEITCRGVVAAEDAAHAYYVAESNRQQIIGDDYEIDVGNQLVKGCKLPSGWDEDCHPYSWRDEKTIRQFFGEE